MSTPLVVPKLPECSSHSPSDASASGADHFAPASTAYYTDLITQSLIPGLVFGGLALLGAIFFFVWICVQCACLRRRRKGDAEEVFIVKTEESQAGPTAVSVDYNDAKSADCTASRPFLAVTVLFALAVLGISVWGLVESIQQTSNTFSGFWNIADGVEARVTDINSTLGDLFQTAAAISQVTGQAQNLVDLKVVTDQIVGTAEYVQHDVLEGIVLKNIDSISDQYRAPTLAVEDKWRFIPIAVIFGLTILLSALVGIMVWRMRFPKTTSLVLLLLWVDVALLMLLGAGLLSGAQVLSGDACLYAESFVMRRVDLMADGDGKEKVKNALGYYFNVTADIPQNELISNLTGVIPPGPISAGQYRDMLQALAAGAASDPSNPVLADITRLEGAVTRLEGLVSRTSMDELYNATKEYLCCTLHDSAYNLFISWTVAGCLGFVLCLLCSIRVVRHTFSSRRGR